MKNAIKKIIPSVLNRALKESAGLPEIIAKAEKIAQNITPGAHRQRRSGGGEYFWQFREYDPLDRAQDIDWRQSAKGDRLYVRQNEWQTSQSLLFWCQNDSGMEFSSSPALPTKIEAAMIITAGLAILAEHSKEHIRPLYKTDKFTAPVVQRLAQYLYHDCNDALPDTANIVAPKNSSVILTGDFLAPMEEIKKSLHLLKHQVPDGLLIQVLDPAELNLPYEGRVIFQNSGGANRHIINHVGSVRSDYIRRITAHIEELRDECRKLGYSYIGFRTDEDIRSLLLYLQTLLAGEQTVKKGGAG